MRKLKIRNFGPIREGCQENDGWIEIPKTTVFIGNQGSGKSTAAKLFSTFSWIEKALVRGDFGVERFIGNEDFRYQFLTYHRLENYFNDSSNKRAELEYRGDAYHIQFWQGELLIKGSPKKEYPLPQIMYVPAERNFIAYVQSPKELKLSSDSLQEFLTEYHNAKQKMKEPMALPINNVKVEYDKQNDIINILGDDYKANLVEASSGFQSLVPLFLVSEFLSTAVNQRNGSEEVMSPEERERFTKRIQEIQENESLTAEQRRLATSGLASQFNKTAFINIVEEPEQNLFPTSQWQMLKNLLEINNRSVGNELLMTTHSPYIINYLSIAIQAGELREKIRERLNLKNKLEGIVPLQSVVSGDEVAVYEFKERKGEISKLGNYEGIPSDKNMLNTSLREGNNMFNALLEIEQEL